MNNPPHGPPYDRERERERDEEQRRAHALQQQELAQREQTERQERERQHREHYQPAPPHQNDTGSIPIHQPVASRLPGAISPGGLLANQHAGPPPAAAAPLGAPSGPGNAFGGPLHNEANRPIQHNAQTAASQLQQQQGFGPSILHHNNAPPSVPIGAPGASGVAFGGPLQQQQQTQQQQQEAVSRLQGLPFGGPIAPGHQIPGAPALGQGGQQPILNDALSYLDQVKVQFADQPDVYNRFLDIMKDFKSQAIDTPGVINRVSELFAGHPNLIQGFNTFLPPGYRIECGAGNDPNTIRVTTPMGTTVQSITGAGRPLPDTALGQAGGGSGYYGPQPRHGNWQQQPQHSIESPESVFSPQNQNAGPAYAQNQAQHSSYEAQQAAAAHQQQQRGVSQLTNAVATIGGHPPRNTQTPTPGGQAGLNGAGAQQGLEKRGPVEFNHAISYVNKIKNRFQDRPEIYKQFLEILQTYQRESKPIQDVYAQVTHLFNTAPDLLEDFKQFLPESAAQAKAAAQKAAEEAMSNANQTPQQSYARADGQAKMPPTGVFLPASTSKESKKRPRTNVAPVSTISAGPSSVNKKAKVTHNKAVTADAQAVSPTLTPVLPEPLPPTTTSAATPEELAFFDRVKKHIGDKKRMNEFLKLCNLFSQDMIDREVLIHKASAFIGMSGDLMTWFKDFVGYDGPTQEALQPIDNRPKPPTGRVSLSNCRGLGPSYRLLPRRERLKPCSGRDEMCNEVLNDDWASHPTWASEDSGFVAHRKNLYEEGLHRIEEERHDYDFNIEANAKVIQLLEPIAQNLLALSPEERSNYRMPIGLGGQSQAIYKRVLKKIYGDKGPEVAADLFKDPAAVLPIVLARLKQKDEEWRFTQREWEKVWNAQTITMYLRSLDHMGLSVKQADKRNFSQKHLIDAIKTKHEEQRRQRALKRADVPWHQYAYTFSDSEVIKHVLRFMVMYASNASQHNTPERRRITEFFEKFITAFFGLSEDEVAECTRDIDRGTPDDDFDESTPLELPNGNRGRRPVNGRKTDLRRGVLDKSRNGTRGRGSKEDSTTGSKESTPDVESVDEDAGETAEDRAVTEVTSERWMTAAPGPIAIHGTKDLSAEDIRLQADQPYKQEQFSLYANQTIYVFFTVFQTLYRRLKEIKESEAEAVEEGIRATKEKPAEKIGLMESRPEFHQPLNNESYYVRTLSLIEDYISNDLDEAKYHDFLRHYYLKKGWQLYTITDLLKTLARLGSVCASVDAKEKTPDLIEQFYRNRESKETTYNLEINMRKQADKYVKDGELFVIKWAPARNEATVRWIQREETTFDVDDMERMAAWQYYISSYIRIEPTEGVSRAAMDRSLLAKQLPTPDSDAEQPKPLIYDENLTLLVCANTYKILYQKDTSEWFIWGKNSFGTNPETGVSFARERLQKYEDLRKQRFKEKFEMNNAWMKDMNHEEVSKKTMDFKKLVDEGIVPGTEVPAAAGSGDVEMAQ